MTFQLTQSLSNGFNDIRKELVENSNKEGLKELRELWNENILHLEQLFAKLTQIEHDELQRSQVLERVFIKYESGHVVIQLFP